MKNFIVIEGGEGSGKGTLIKRLIKKFEKYPDLDVLFTREPGGTDYGEEIRKPLLSSDMKGKISLLSEIFSFCAVRANHCDLVVRPALESNRIVISDRFDASTIAYQIYDRAGDKLEEIFFDNNAVAKGLGTDIVINPGLVIFLDIEPETGLRRVNARNDENTRFDDEKLDFHKRVRDGYLSQRSDSWKVIDSSQSKEKVFEDAWEAIKEFLEIRGDE